MTAAGWETCLLDLRDAGVLICLGSGAGAGAGAAPSSLFSSTGLRGGGSLLLFFGGGSSRGGWAAFWADSKELFTTVLSLLSFFSVALDFFSFFFTARRTKQGRDAYK